MTTLILVSGGSTVWIYNLEARFGVYFVFSIKREQNRRTSGSGENRGSVHGAHIASFITSMCTSCGQLDTVTHVHRVEYLEG
jgi:hypothetical protein